MGSRLEALRRLAEEPNRALLSHARKLASDLGHRQAMEQMLAELSPHRGGDLSDARQRVLDWIAALEDVGVEGDGAGFSQAEKIAAATVPWKAA